MKVHISRRTDYWNGEDGEVMPPQRRLQKNPSRTTP